MSERFSSIEAAVEAIRNGQVIIVVDAEERENEGDFVCAAEKVTPEIVNFMITHGRGQLCMPILPEVSERLKLAPMVEANTTPLGTSYTVPVDHRTSRTGITAQERAKTIQAIVDLPFAVSPIVGGQRKSALAKWNSWRPCRCPAALYLAWTSGWLFQTALT